jgi:hypothetical protein
MDVLVAPLQTANWLLSYIPGLRKIFGGRSWRFRYMWEGQSTSLSSFLWARGG